MLTWADVGNGWRNLFLLSCAVQALGLGVFFAARRLIGKSRVASFLLGAAVTPIVQFLWMLLMGAVWARAPKLLLIGAPPALAAVYLLAWLLRRLRRVPAMIGAAWRQVIRWFAMDRGGLICLTLALALTVIFLPICVRFCIQNNNTYTDAGEYLAMGQRYCEDRDLGALLSKDDGDGSFRPNSHFPAMELYFAYGLLHTAQEQVGYPYDKPVFTGIGLLLFYFAAAYAAALWLVTRGKPRWLALGVLLLNLVPDLFFSANGAPRDVYRLLATLTLFGFLWSIRPDGSWKRMLGKAALWLIVCFACMATHVVMFVVLPFMVAAWVLACFFEAWARKQAHPWRTLGRAVLLALSGAVGTVAAFAGNIACYLKTGEMSPFRLMTTYTSAPWFELYEKMEYRSTEASTTVNFFKSYNDVLMKWQTPIGVWAAALAVLIVALGLIALVVRRRRGLSDGTSRLWGAALLLLLTLLPMTGLIDTPVYSFSGAFLKLNRYTMQWFVLCAVLLTAAGAWAEEQWAPLCAFVKQKRLTKREVPVKLKALTRQAPALLCVCACAFSFVQGTSQSGYDNSFFRYSRDVMEDESYILDTGFLARYHTLLALAPHVGEEQKILYTNKGEQYALNGRGYSLTANPIVPLMALLKDEVGQALADMNVALIVTDKSYWDDRYFAKSELSDYLSELPQGQIIEDEKMRFYLIDPALAAFVPGDGQLANAE